ncbi:MAG: hydrogenase accessory protein HypB, partial [Spirochaetaceae bacterium]
YRCIVLEGDVETARDAERLAGKKIHAHQIVTKGACHLSAQTIYQVLSDQNLENMNFVFVENVGNLVCPAEFDIGETCKIAVLSVTEGEDKPLKYPLLFRDSRAVVLTKMDLIPHLDVDADMYQKNIRNVNNNIPVYPVSAKTGDGLAKLLEWLFNLR